MPNLDFDGHNTLYATHGLHAYAAKCPPQLVEYGLQQYSKPGDLVLDPMTGSGTTLVEARLKARRALGFDIDPLACLIANVKSQVIDDLDIKQAFDTVVAKSTQDLATLKSGEAPSEIYDRALPPEFDNHDYWFAPEISAGLAILSYHIGQTPMPEPVRNFLWVAFSSLILAKNSVANARDIIHSRHHYRKHPQLPDVLGKFAARVARMRTQMAEFKALCQSVPKTRAMAHRGDARNLPLEDETVDLIFTSPPYSTALDYPRAHFLAVAWMEKPLGVDLKAYRTKSPEYIGSEHGRLPRKLILDACLTKFDLTQSIILQLNETSPRQAKLTQRYFLDMAQVFGEMNRVLKKHRYAVIVVCPSHIRKVEVPTHQVFAEMGQDIGLRLKEQHTRTISERRRILPYMQEAFGQRMNTEYVLVFQKP